MTASDRSAVAAESVTGDISPHIVAARIEADRALKAARHAATGSVGAAYWYLQAAREAVQGLQHEYETLVDLAMFIPDEKDAKEALAMRVHRYLRRRWLSPQLEESLRELDKLIKKWEKQEETLALSGGAAGDAKPTVATAVSELQEWARVQLGEGKNQMPVITGVGRDWLLGLEEKLGSAPSAEIREMARTQSGFASWPGKLLQGLGEAVTAMAERPSVRLNQQSQSKDP